MSFNGVLLYIRTYCTKSAAESKEGGRGHSNSTAPLCSYSEISNHCVFSCLVQWAQLRTHLARSGEILPSLYNVCRPQGSNDAHISTPREKRGVAIRRDGRCKIHQALNTLVKLLLNSSFLLTSQIKVKDGLIFDLITPARLSVLSPCFEQGS